MSRHSRTWIPRTGWFGHVVNALVVAAAVAVTVLVFWGIALLVPSPWHWVVMAVVFVLGYGTLSWFADPRRGFK